MLNFVSSLLQMLAFAFVFYVFSPSFTAFSPNPYLFALHRLTSKIIGVVRTALPLPEKVLAGVLFFFCLLGRSALLYKMNLNTLVVGSIMEYQFQLTHFVNWWIFALLQFVLFYIALLSANVLLRLWHFMRPLPGATGDALNHFTRPFSSFKLPLQILFIFILTIGIVLVCHSTAGSEKNLLALVATELFPDNETLKSFANISYLGLGYQAILLAALEFLSVIETFATYLFLLIFFSLISLFFRTPSTEMFIQEMFTLLQGPFRRIQIGPIIITPIIAFLVLKLAYTLATEGVLFLAWGLQYVVQHL